jgi:hypothetical protein
MRSAAEVGTVQYQNVRDACVAKWKVLVVVVLQVLKMRKEQMLSATAMVALAAVTVMYMLQTMISYNERLNLTLSQYLEIAVYDLSVEK